MTPLRSEWGMPPEALQSMPGYDPDIGKNRPEARQIMQKLSDGLPFSCAVGQGIPDRGHTSVAQEPEVRLTLCWREVDSNYRFRVARCLRVVASAAPSEFAEAVLVGKGGNQVTPDRRRRGP